MHREKCSMKFVSLQPPKKQKTGKTKNPTENENMNGMRRGWGVGGEWGRGGVPRQYLCKGGPPSLGKTSEGNPSRK